MTWTTTDLSDDHPQAQTALPVLSHFGGRHHFHGPITTVHVFEDNVLVRRALETVLEGSVLVVDGGGSLRCALVGDRLAAIARDRALGGIVINGCVRDAVELADLDVGVMALAAVPRRSVKQGNGEVDVPVMFAGLTFEPGHHLYADADGILVSATPLA